MMIAIRSFSPVRFAAVSNPAPVTPEATVSFAAFQRDWSASGCCDPRLDCIGDIPSLPAADRAKAFNIALTNDGIQTPLTEDQKDALVTAFDSVPPVARPGVLQIANQENAGPSGLGSTRLDQLRAKQ